MQTRMTQLLGTRTPIVQGGMQNLTNAEFVAAVCNAGALGILNATVHPELSAVREEVRKLRALTDQPFALNISMLPETTEDELTDAYFQLVLDEGVKVVETAGRNPEKYVPMLKEAGVKIIHKVPAVRYALKAQSIGVDMVTLVGFECAGHPGMDDVATSVLIQRAAEVLDIPVIAGGGIVDGRGLVAALAWGADGVVMGTRFAATKECPLNEKYKEWMVEAGERDTIMIQRNIKNTLRAMRNEVAEEVLAMEQQGAGLAELMPLISGKRSRKYMEEGNLQQGIFAVGQGVGLVHGLKTCAEVVNDTMREAQEIVARLQNCGL